MPHGRKLTKTEILEMRSIDIHAHISPESCFDSMRKGKDWYGITPEQIFNNIDF